MYACYTIIFYRKSGTLGSIYKEFSDNSSSGLNHFQPAVSERELTGSISEKNGRYPAVPEYRTKRRNRNKTLQASARRKRTPTDPGKGKGSVIVRRRQIKADPLDGTHPDTSFEALRVFVLRHARSRIFIYSYPSRWLLRNLLHGSGVWAC